MTTTPNLAIAHIAENQAAKEVTANDAFTALDQALTDVFPVSVASGNVTLTTAQTTRAILLRISGASVAGREVVVPAAKRLFSVTLDGASSESVDIVRGTTAITIQPATGAILYTDGTSNGLARITEDGVAAFISLTDTFGFTGNGKKLARVNSGETALEAVVQHYDIKAFIGEPPTTGEVIFEADGMPAGRFLATMPLSRFSAGVAATAQTDLSVKKNGTEFAVLRWAAAGTVASILGAGGSGTPAETAFSTTDVLQVVAPATADASLARIRMHFAFTLD